MEVEKVENYQKNEKKLMEEKKKNKKDVKKETIRKIWL